MAAEQPAPRRNRRRRPRRSGSSENTENTTSEPKPPGDKAIPVDECKFAQFGLGDDLLKGIAACGYRDPSPIQERTIPPALEGRDFIGQARTGTGKTAAFLIPALQRLSDLPGPRVLVVVPTRELAMQVAAEAKSLTQYLGVGTSAIYGGAPMPKQIAEKILADH